LLLLTTPYVLGIDDSPDKNLLRQVAARRETLEGTLSNFTGARARGWLFHPADGNDDILIVRPKTKLTSIAATYTRVLGAEVEDLAGPRIELGTGTWLRHPLLGAGSLYQVVLDSWRVTAAWAGTAVRVGSATSTRLPSCSTTTNTICQRSAAAPKNSATAAHPVYHASAIGRQPEDP
jgi:hypothetical protein